MQIRAASGNQTGLDKKQRQPGTHDGAVNMQPRRELRRAENQLQIVAGRKSPKHQSESNLARAEIETAIEVTACSQKGIHGLFHYNRKGWRIPPRFPKGFFSGKAREPAQNTLDRGFVRRTDDAAAREARLNEHRLLLGELPKPELAMIVALSGCPDAAEGQAFLRDVQQGIVDRHAPGYRAGEDLFTRRRIPAEPIKRQRPLMPVYIRQRLYQRVVGNNRQDRTEDLFIHDSHAVRYIEQQGWRPLP